MKIPDIYVEKDYWVTFALYNIFSNTIGRETVFKGGTALLKCFGIIDRFSEDIDLVVIRRDGESNNRMTNKIKEIGKIVSNVLPEVEMVGITHKMGMNRKTAHIYSKEFLGKYGQVRDVIIIEATWLGYYEPYTEKEINSFVYTMMKKTGQEELASNYGMKPFKVLTLKPERTLCEKIMSLVRFSYSEIPLEDLKQKIRHPYDLNQMLKNKDVLEFFKSEYFDEMLFKVANDVILSFKSNNSWLVHHPNEAKIFKEAENLWNELKLTYSEEFKNLVFGEFPKENEILETLIDIRNRMKQINWSIKIS
jgi:hypothetical protein